MQGRIEEAGFIKGVAILGVIFIHVTAFSLRNTEPLTEGGLFFVINQMGRFSVPVFFMLSGLLLFHRYYHDEFLASAFFKRRGLYIVVPYVIWSVFYLAYSWLAHPESAPRTVMEVLTVFITGEAYYHLYYIVVMVQFYLLFPLLIHAFRRFGGLTVVSFALLVNVIADSMTWWELSVNFPWMEPFSENAIRFFPVWFFYFCLGGWIGQRVNRMKERMKRVPFSAIAAFFISAGLLMLFESLFRKHTGFFNFSVLVYSISSLMMWFYVAGKWNHSWLSVLGRYSFGLYFIHPLVLNLFSRISPFPAASWIEFGFMLIAVTGLSLALSMLIRRWPYSYLLIGK